MIQDESGFSLVSWSLPSTMKEGVQHKQTRGRFADVSRSTRGGCTSQELLLEVESPLLPCTFGLAAVAGPAYRRGPSPAPHTLVLLHSGQGPLAMLNSYYRGYTLSASMPGMFWSRVIIAEKETTHV
jgi:hypothetical protein